MDAMHVELNKIYRLPDFTLGDEKDYDSYKGTNESGEMQRSIWEREKTLWKQTGI